MAAGMTSMIRPASIVRYEQYYLASFALSLLASFMTWSTRVAMQAANPILASMPWVLPAAFLVGIVVTLLLWYFTAWQASVVAKWVVVVFAGFAVIGLLMNALALVAKTAPSLPGVVIAMLSSALYIAAAVHLFTPDAKAWFGDDMFEQAEPRA